MGIAVQTDMGLPPILAFGSEEQKRAWAAPAIAGEAILCLGITEPDAGSDVAGINTRAVRDKTTGEWIINGSKTYITNGHRADAIVLVTRTGATSQDGAETTASPCSWWGWTFRASSVRSGSTSWGCTRPTPRCSRSRTCGVPSDAVLGEVGKGFYHIMWELQGERLIGPRGRSRAASTCSTARSRTRSSGARSAARSATSR